MPTDPARPDGATNRLIEDQVGELGGHKSLYSDVYYSRGRVRPALRREAYRALKDQYDPDHGSWISTTKVVQRR